VSAASIASMASVALVLICLAAIASPLLGAMASINSDDPADRGMTDLGHRCVVWVSVVLLFGVVMMLAAESVAP